MRCAAPFVLSALGAAACSPPIVALDLSPSPSTQSLLLVVERMNEAPALFAGQGPAAGAIALPAVFDRQRGERLDLDLLEYQEPLLVLGLSIGPLALGDCRSVPAYASSSHAILDGTSSPQWSRAPVAPSVAALRLPCLACTSGYHAGGGGYCAPAGACAQGFHDDGTGSCAPLGSCASDRHDGGQGDCLPLGRCDAGLHDGGDGRCVAAGTCAPGFHDRGDGGCARFGFCDALHSDGGDGTCVPAGSCSTGYTALGAGICAPAVGCTPGQHDGGGGACVVRGACAAGFTLESGGSCYRLLRLTGATTARREHSATLLGSGLLLLAGGVDSSYQAMAEVDLYDPARGEVARQESLPAPRHAHVAALLPGGEVLLTAGSAAAEPTRATFVRDPASGQWSDSGTTEVARTSGAILETLVDGRLLLAGGFDGLGSATRDAEVFDLSLRRWSPIAPTPVGAVGAAGVTLRDGRVFDAGGWAPGVAAIDGVFVYDPDRAQWDRAADLAGRFGHAAVELGSGEVLLIGGVRSATTTAGFLKSVDAWAGSVLTTPIPDMSLRRYNATATVLRDGRVLVAGGTDGLDPLELYDPISGTWSVLGEARMERTSHSATLLEDGSVLFIGGSPSSVSTVSLGDVDRFEIGAR
jgi:hypothetical protein